jgi:hypothetical protein
MPLTEFKQHTARGVGAASALLLPGLFTLLVAAAGPACAAEKETRDFTVTIDRKPAGKFSMTIARQDDGTVSVAVAANVRVSYLVYKYHYSYQGTEVWKNGRLLSLNSNSYDNGKSYLVAVTGESDALRVRVNGTEHKSRPDAWTTTYWHSPDPRFRNQKVPLLDADTGKDIISTLQFLGTDRIRVVGQDQDCSHYRIVGGGLQVELWYDPQERLVRETSIEDGHPTIMDLAQIRR